MKHDCPNLRELSDTELGLVAGGSVYSQGLLEAVAYYTEAEIVVNGSGGGGGGVSFLDNGSLERFGSSWVGGGFSALSVAFGALSGVLPGALLADSDGDGTPNIDDTAPTDANQGGTINIIGSLEGIDDCGSSFFNAPDVLFGVRISLACYDHDFNYSSESTMSRLEADYQLFFDIYDRLTSQGIDVVSASSAAFTYFEAVRGAGWLAYEGKGSPF